MDYVGKYNTWLNHDNIDKELKEELISISNNEADTKDRFYKDLEFGTAGLRGKLGVGTNRMNVHTVALVTQGLANYLIEHREPGISVVIGYDVRYMSREFADVVASILANSGIQVHLFKDIAPTPLLSYAVRELKADAGIMITASHNPKEYNGYKVYGEDGGQILEEAVDSIMNMMKNEDILSIKLSTNEFNLISFVGENLIEEYKQKIIAINYNDNIDKDINVVFTPLNGTGLMIEEILGRRGYGNVFTVKEERNPDPDFTTTNSPNPEDPKVFRLAEKVGKLNNADILIATDPDADRVGVEVLHEGNYIYLSGNQIGSLLTNYILDKNLPPNSTIIKTIVTGNLVNKIANKYGAETISVLVGFKNIYKLVKEWEITNEKHFIMGFEESLGFGLATFVRDKDAVLASSIIVEMAAHYKKYDKTLINVLEDLYCEFGYFDEILFSKTLEGLDGSLKVKQIMKDFRTKPIVSVGDAHLVSKVDYLFDDTGLDRNNTLIYKYSDDTWFAIRPSGTEPKIKFYIYTYGNSSNEANVKINLVKKLIEDRL